MRMRTVIVGGRQFCTGGRGIRFVLVETSCHVLIVFSSTAICSGTHFHPVHTIQPA
jgi:hypothetical protein